MSSTEQDVEGKLKEQKDSSSKTNLTVKLIVKTSKFWRGPYRLLEKLDGSSFSSIRYVRVSGGQVEGPYFFQNDSISILVETQQHHYSCHLSRPQIGATSTFTSTQTHTHTHTHDSPVIYRHHQHRHKHHRQRQNLHYQAAACSVLRLVHKLDGGNFLDEIVG